MTPEGRREVEEHIHELDDGSLRRLVALELSQYQPGAAEIARDELSRRRLPVLSPEEYWTQFRDEWLAGVRFCFRCWAETTDESPGLTLTINFIGTRLLGSDDPCPECGSVVRKMWFCVVLPLIPLDRYRMIRLRRGQYIGRRLKRADR